MIRVIHAVDFACRKHAKQTRKGEEGEPYINHLAEVARLVADATEGGDANLVIAALLHDVIEDQGVERDEIAALFGEDVASLVTEVTDDKTKPKSERKRLQVEHAAKISSRARIVKIADKTSNLRSILNSRPPWPFERKRRYFAWAKAVVIGTCGVNQIVERAFDAEYERGVIAGIAERGFVWHVGLEVENDVEAPPQRVQ